MTQKRLNYDKSDFVTKLPIDHENNIMFLFLIPVKEVVSQHIKIRQKNGKFALRASMVVEMKVFKVADEVANMVVDRKSSG